jgi:membrane-associated protease RseP (regulator of RpoE activity)
MDALSIKPGLSLVAARLVLAAILFFPVGLARAASLAPWSSPQPQDLMVPRPAGEPLGLRLEPLTPAVARRLEVSAPAGVVVTRVDAISPAADAGIRPGDVIVAVNEGRVDSVGDFRELLADARQAGEPILLLVHRQSERLFVAIDVGTSGQG